MDLSISFHNFYFFFRQIVKLVNQLVYLVFKGGGVGSKRGLFESLWLFRPARIFLVGCSSAEPVSAYLTNKYKSKEKE